MKVITERMAAEGLDKLLADQWGIDEECVNCKVYDENTQHPSYLSVCDGCYGSKSHPNFKAKVPHTFENCQRIGCPVLPENATPKLCASCGYFQAKVKT